MKFKDLELKINNIIKEKNIDTEYKCLWQVVDEIKSVISGLIYDDYIKNNSLLITTYKNNIVIKNYQTSREVVIKLKKKRSETEYKIGNFSWGYSWGYYYTIKEVEIDDNEFKSIEDFIKCNKQIILEKKDRENKQQERFENSLKNFNLSFEDFYSIYNQYKNLNWKTRNKYEKNV